MKLVAHVIDGRQVSIRAARLERDWMDASPQRFAYRCLPLAIANTFGWEVLCPSAFKAVWAGEPEIESIRIEAADGAPPPAISHFGSGILTFHLPCIFRTESGYDLLVQGPINRPKDAIAPLTGIVECDWAPFTFTMNWRFTQPEIEVDFEKDEPFCHIFPVRRGELESVEPEMRWLSCDPDLHDQYRIWDSGRRSFNEELKVPGSKAQAEKWQKQYYRGIDARGQAGPQDHRTRLRLREFATAGLSVPAGAAGAGLSPETLELAAARLRRFPLFSEADYGELNPDLGEQGGALHLLRHGAAEYRTAFKPERVAQWMAALAGAAPPPAPDPLPPEWIAERLRAAPPIGLFRSSQGNAYMRDIAEDLSAELRQAGLSVAIADETSDVAARPEVSIFVAPHEFFTLGRGTDWARDDVLRTAFMLTTEQVQTRWFVRALPFVLASRGILDLSAQSAGLFAETGLPALHITPGARLGPYRLRPEDRAHPLFAALPHEAHATPDPRSPFAERALDIAFFGAASASRGSFLARNAGLLARFRNVIYCRPTSRGVLAGEDAALTRLAAHASGHARITLNLHRDAAGYFEWHRMVRLGIASGSLIVSEPCLPQPQFRAGEHYLEARAADLPELLRWLLETPEGEAEAERVRANAARLLAESFAPEESAARLVEFLLAHG